MKRLFAVLLILSLLAGVALAEGAASVAAFVEREGYKAVSVKNKAGLVGCWFIEDADTDTLQWSDKDRVYTVSTSADSAFRALYVEIAGMAEWDTCSYTANGRVQFAYNAPDSNSVKDYKTLKNYVKYVGEYVDKQQPIQPAETKTGRQTYIINKSSKKFHYEDCPSVARMKKENREKFTGNRSELIAQGYEPCKNCNP